MKKKLLTLATIFFAIICININSFAATDKINNYTIKVSPKDNASLDLIYHIEWQVLDTSTVGPLTELYIGIPNKYVSSIIPVSKNIKSIKYVDSYNGYSGDYIHIIFNREYKDRQVATIDFKINQNNMYTISNNSCKFTFKPGWFDDVVINDVTILWDTQNVVSADSKNQNDGYYRWYLQTMNRSFEANVTYFTSTFPNIQYSKPEIKKDEPNSDAIVAIVLIVTVIIWVSLFPSKRSYYSHRGYGYDYDYGYGRSSYRHRPYRSHSYSRSSYSSRSSCVSSCACACACAGGGRAGCSKKDLYGIKLSSMKKIFKKGSK